jgi:triacylglycerol lipase
MAKAALCTCAIGTPEGITSSQGHDDIGFTQPPKVFQAGPTLADACLIGTNTLDGVILSFRGTLPFDLCDLTSVADWLNSVRATLVPGPGGTGRVHAGFNQSLDHLWVCGIAEEVHAQVKASGYRPLHITGHSKGGAMALLAMARLAAEGLPVSSITTFGAPRAGDREFINSLTSLHNGPVIWRFEHQDDLVPHLPPRPLLARMIGEIAQRIGNGIAGGQFDHTPAGTLEFINWDDDLETDSIWLEIRRISSLAQRLFHRQLGEVVENHDQKTSYTDKIARLAT